MNTPLSPTSSSSPIFCEKKNDSKFSTVSSFSDFSAPFRKSLTVFSLASLTPISFWDPQLFSLCARSQKYAPIFIVDANRAKCKKSDSVSIFEQNNDLSNLSASSLRSDAVSTKENSETHSQSQSCSNFDPLPFSWKNFWYSVAYFGGVFCLTLYLLRRFFYKFWYFSSATPQLRETSFSHFKECLEHSKIQTLTYFGEKFVYYTDREGLHYLANLIPGSKKYIFRKVVETAIPSLHSFPEESLFTASSSFFQRLSSFFAEIGQMFYPLQLTFSLGGLFLFCASLLGLPYVFNKSSNIFKFQVRTKSKASVSFADVVGMKKVKQEFFQIIDFVKNPEKIQKLGVRLPRGILLEGPSGTGKTLMAKALAGEAELPFCSVSASQFIEMYVGQGAARIRGIFSKARSQAPCILFIDELDAFGIDRTIVGKSSQEYVQTLNQFLIELDGIETNLTNDEYDNDTLFDFSRLFTQSKLMHCNSEDATVASPPFVLVVAATNRVEVLDKALIRPGRFDRIIHIDLPTVDEREALFHFHSRKKSLGEDVLLREFAAASEGFSGADIEGLLNEAAFLAAREGEVFLQGCHIWEVLQSMKSRKKLLSSKENSTLEPFSFEDILSAFQT